MADQQNTTEQMRAQFQIGGQMTQNLIQAAADLTVTTATYGFQAMEQGMRYTTDVRGQSERLAHETFQTYRRVYEDGLRTWQGYLQGVTEIMTRKI
ncbi:MAG: hypothetical protein H0X37_00680 [Herpetosiphonaceae bacterium]|nr:hypothetical protein [Herpetosiphonaceae bacterium]